MLLEDDAPPGIAEPHVEEEAPQGLARTARVRRDDHALAGREAVRLQHGRVRGAVHLRLGLLIGVEHHVRGRRHAGFPHDLLRESLAALQGGRRRGGAERPQALRLERVHEAGHQRRLGPHDREAGALAGRERDQRVHVLGGHVEAGRVFGDAGIARRAQHLRVPRAAAERTHDRVLAPAGPHHQDSHRVLWCAT